MTDKTLGLTKEEYSVIKKLKTPIMIQDFLDTLPTNYEKKGETYMSPRRVLREKKAHCFEAALLSATAMWLNGKKPLVIDLKTSTGDDHIISLYRHNGYWGAISKTNHNIARFRDPVYRTLRELVLSYFHEYTDYKIRNKVLRSYSKPFDLSKLGTDWVTTEKDMFDLADKFDSLPHFSILPKANTKHVRPPDKLERRVGVLTEWSKSDPRT